MKLTFCSNSSDKWKQKEHENDFEDQTKPNIEHPNNSAIKYFNINPLRIKTITLDEILNKAHPYNTSIHGNKLDESYLCSHFKIENSMGERKRDSFHDKLTKSVSHTM